MSPHPDPLLTILQRLDHLPDEVTDFEAGVLETCLRFVQQGRAITPKQRRVLVQMCERYGLLQAAAELLGQQPLL